MTLLKRFELWLLLILIGGGLYYVLDLSEPDQASATGQRPAIPSDTKEQIQNKTPARFALKNTVITRNDDHFLLEIEVLCRNTNNEALLLRSPNTQLVAANGQDAPSFFLPFQALKEVPASSEKSITLRYWLNLDQLKGPISLKIDGENLEIKSSTFDSASLVDKKSLTFTSADWTPES